MSSFESNGKEPIENEAEQIMSWISGKDDGVVREANMPRAGSEWYVVSSRWLNKWKVFTRIAEPQSLDQDPDESPGPINSEDILLETDFLKTLENDWYDLVLKPGLVLGLDYELLPPKAWAALKKQFGVNPKSTIKRTSIDVTEYETQVEVTLKKIQIVIFPPMNREQSDLKLDTIYSSVKTQIEYLNARIRKIYSQANSRSVTYSRLWKVNSDTTLTDLKELVKKSDDARYEVEFPGEFIEPTVKIENSEIGEEDILVCELKEDYSRIWRFKLRTEKCEYCNSYKSPSALIKCQCKKYYYCNINCMKRDSSYHNCNEAKQSSFQDNRSSALSTTSSSRMYGSSSSYSYNNSRNEAVNKTYSRKDNSRMGLTGLQNLGNTCFMNSGLQCLSNTYPLTAYLLEDRHIPDINRANVLGTGGKLVEEYANLIKEIWYENSRSTSPWRFKSALSSFAHQFSGYQQHDSQELLSFLLDGLHEDLNKITRKPYIEEFKTAGLDEIQQADMFWQHHLSRNQSIIVDLMHGQYRSEVTCPKCSKVSLTFDPYLMLALPLPNKKVKSFDVMFVYSDPRRSAISMQVQVDSRACIRDLRESIASNLGISSSSISLAKLYSHSLEDFLVDEKPISGLLSTSCSLIAYEVQYLNPGEVQILIDTSKESQYSYSYRKSKTSYTRLLTISSSISYSDLHFEIFKYYYRSLQAESGDIQMMSPEEISLAEDEEKHKFRKLFPEYFDEIGNNLYKVTLVNPANISRSYSSNNYSFSSNYYSTPPCPYCNSKNCNNCILPFSEDSILETLNQRTPLRLECVWQVNSMDYMQKLNKYELHDSIRESRVRQQAMNEERASIHDCFRLMSQPKQLDEDNKWYCPSCKEHVLAKKKMDIWRVPEVLIIHLMRFKQSGYYRKKNGKVVNFPLEGLDISEYVLGPQKKPLVYDCYAVSNHYGSMSGGHYTAFGKNEITQEWYHFDDSSVDSVRGDIVTSAAYVLFYKLRKV